MSAILKIEAVGFRYMRAVKGNKESTLPGLNSQPYAARQSRFLVYHQPLPNQAIPIGSYAAWARPTVLLRDPEK